MTYRKIVENSRVFNTFKRMNSSKLKNEFWVFVDSKDLLESKEFKEELLEVEDLFKLYKESGELLYIPSLVFYTSKSFIEDIKNITNDLTISHSIITSEDLKKDIKLLFNNPETGILNTIYISKSYKRKSYNGCGFGIEVLVFPKTRTKADEERLKFLGLSVRLRNGLILFV